MSLAFDEETHVYKIDGRVVPSVTQVLKGAGLIDTAWFNDEARDRGTYVAQATQWLDEGTLDYDALDPKLKPYVLAWEKFAYLENEIEIVSVEARVANHPRMYAGTLDRLMRWNGYIWVIDIKTGASQAWHGLQTAAYQECVTGGALYRGSVVLKPDGTYKFKEHKDRNDRNAFLSALNLYHWKKEKGLI